MNKVIDLVKYIQVEMNKDDENEIKKTETHIITDSRNANKTRATLKIRKEFAKK